MNIYPHKKALQSPPDGHPEDVSPHRALEQFREHLLPRSPGLLAVPLRSPKADHLTLAIQWYAILCIRLSGKRHCSSSPGPLYPVRSSCCDVASPTADGVLGLNGKGILMPHI